MFFIASFVLFLLQGTAFALTQDADGFYLVGSSSDWKAFAKKVNDGVEGTAKAKLTADIDFGDTVLANWHSDGMIGNQYFRAFTGEFDGAGHTVKIRAKAEGESNIALFGHIAGNAVIRNLTVDGEFKNTKGGAAAVVANMYNNTPAVENCVNRANITSGGTEHTKGAAGGIACYATNGTVTGCRNEGEVQGSKFAGGIAAIVSSSCSVENCENSGSVAVTDGTEKGRSAGGIAGQNGGKLLNCKNSDTITCAEGEEAGAAGGIAGTVSQNNPSDKLPEVTGCENSGDVSGDKNVSAGGIAGSLKAESSEERAKISNCINNGPISDSRQSGGIVGNAVKNADIVKCVNTAEVTAVDDGTTEADGAGGVVGRMVDEPGMAVSNCSSSANVTATGEESYVGGVIGYNIGTTQQIEDCTWLKTDTVGPEHGRGKPENLDGGTVSKDNKQELPATVLVLDSYAKRGNTFDFKATVYPEGAVPLMSPVSITLPEGLKINPSDFMTGVLNIGVEVTEGEAGETYTVTAECEGLTADFTVTPAEDAEEPDIPPYTGSSGGGCSTGFAALALLAAVPFVLRRKK